MRIGACEVCPAKDAIIDDLRLQLAETQKSLLAMADARAYSLRYPTERQASAPSTPPAPARTPARVRAEQYRPEMTPEAVEASFDEQAALERKLAQG